MFDLTRQERKALLFITIFIATGAVLRVLPFAMSEPSVDLTPSVANVQHKKINVNEADTTELVKLHGVGASTAIKIISYRKANGNFESADDLLLIKGIGPSKLKKIKNQIEF